MANWNIKSRRITDSIQNAAGFVQQSSNVGMIILGVYLIAEGDFNGLVDCPMLSGRRLAFGSAIATSTRLAKSSMTIINQVMEMPDEQEEGKRYIHRPIVQGKIELERVTFHYQTHQWRQFEIEFDDQSWRESGDYRRRIGSGKTTLERLIMGLYQPTEGHVRIDDTDIAQLHHVDIRRNIGCVAQDSNLFFGSIRDNITLGPLTVTGRPVTAFTQSDPAGLERQGEGATLSGGQRQGRRRLLARSLDVRYS